MSLIRCYSLFASLLVIQANLRLPVLFVPPLTGVQLQAKLNKPSPSPYFWCPTQSDWSTLWITPSILVPGVFSCFVENMRLIFSRKSSRSTSIRGVAVRPTHGFEKTLNPLAPLIYELERQGWVWGRQMRAHIYDWRLSPNDWAEADKHGWKDLKESIERLRKLNGNRRVVLTGISMGATYVSAFLQSNKLVDEEWKAANVAGFVSISGVFGGAPSAAQGIISGRLEGLELLFNKNELRTLMRGIPSLSWLIPHPAIYKDQVIIKNTQTYSMYTSGHLDQALSDAGAYQASAAWQQVLAYPSHLAPNVTTFCMYSKGLKTVASLKYHRNDFSDTPAISFLDGDSTVPLAGLKDACDNWARVQSLPVQTKVWKNVGHAGILQAKGGVRYAVDAIIGLGNSHV